MVSLIPALLSGATETIERGQSLEQVTLALGKPVGTLAFGDKTLLLYPQGEVTLRENRVSDFDLMTDAEFAEEQKRKRLEHEAWLIQQETLSAARLENGTRLKAAKLQSNAFAALPAKSRVDYWRAFQVRYPEVDVAEQIAEALELYQAELAAQATEKRIAELEARVTQAEQAAARAQSENERLRARRLTRSYFYDGRYIYNAIPRKPCQTQTRDVVVCSNKQQITHRPAQCPDARKLNRRTISIQSTSAAGCASTAIDRARNQ